ncbi:MAG: hypothetical protein KDB07_06570 [Planctomycetes bacterium]|nr:hypothetical protein [Planctomycetota bacterium]
MTTGQPEALEDAWIQNTLESMDLFAKLATTPVLDELRDQASPPRNYNPTSPRHQASADFQRDLRVRDMHTMAENCAQAVALLRDTPSRELLESLLLSKTPFKKSTRILNKHRGTRYTVEGVSTFYHYFFEVDAIPRSLWSDAIRRRGGSTLKTALHGDSDLVLWRLGEHVVVDLRDGLEEAFTQCHMRLKELRQMPTNFATIKMIQACVDGMTKSHQALTESEVRMKDMLRKLEQFRQSRRQIQVLSAHDLGEFSGPSDTSAKLLMAAEEGLEA